MPSNQKEILINTLNRVPPCLCRMMAVEIRRDKKSTVRRISVSRLIAKSGIPRRSFLRISRMEDWQDVKIGVASDFARACGVNLLQRNPFSEFISKKYQPGLPYFTKAQRKFFDKVLAEKMK